jgi:deazaflavin-dependent oxidoreductase (nitroreductase family)
VGVEIRRRFFWVLDHTLNRVTTPLARSGHGPFSLIRHVGRKTGRSYETPVILARVPEGFVAELTYGENVNWYRNAVAAGGCVVVSGGTEYQVIAIEPYDSLSGRAAYPAPFRNILELTRRNDFRLLRLDAERRELTAPTGSGRAPTG